jgi:Ca2+-binding RTX toxin-like protein
MATITYGKKLPDFDNFAQFDGKTLKISKFNDEAFTWKDKDGTSMVFEGENFEKTQGVITGGTIESVEFYNSKGQRIYTFDNLDADAAEIFKTFSFKSDPIRVLQGLMDGDDTVSGSAKKDSMWGFGGDDTLNGRGGEDWLYGHRGDDILTGGAGADTFAFLTGYDSDTVKDFDLTGKDHDFIYIDYYLYQDLVFTQDGANLILELSTGDTLTLENVTQAQIEGKDKYFDFF